MLRRDLMSTDGRSTYNYMLAENEVLVTNIVGLLSIGYTPEQAANIAIQTVNTNGRPYEYVFNMAWFVGQFVEKNY